MSAVTLRVLAGTAILTMAVVAIPARAQTLSEAMATAYRGNPDLGAARATLRATAEGVPQAQSQLWRPQVTLSGTSTHSRIRLNDKADSSAGSASTKENEKALEHQYGYEIDVPLYDAQVLRQIDEARANAKAGVATLASTEQDILQTVVSAYVDVVLYRRQVEIYSRQAASLEDQRQRAERMLSAGRRTIGDVASIREQVASVKASLATARGELAAAEAQFKSVVGEPPKDLTAWPSLVALPKDLDAALHDAEVTNPTIRNALEKIDAAKAGVSAYEDAALPTLTFQHTFTHTLNSTRYIGSNSNTSSYEEVDSEKEFTFALELSAPIYQGGLVTSEVRAAKQTLSNARLTLDSRRRDVIHSVVSAWKRLVAARQSEKLAGERLAAAQEAEKARAYQVARGQVTVDDYLRAQQTRIGADISLLQARHEIVVRSATLLVATGHLTARDQKLAVTLYDPQADLRRADGRWFGYGD